MSAAGLEKAGALIALLLASPIVARWRVARRARREAERPLFDLVLLEAALAPRAPDDPATLEVLRGLFRSHNHVQDAGTLAPELRRLYLALTAGQRVTLRGVLLRLRECGDPALERVATDATRQITSL